MLQPKQLSSSLDLANDKEDGLITFQGAKEGIDSSFPGTSLEGSKINSNKDKGGKTKTKRNWEEKKRMITIKTKWTITITTKTRTKQQQKSQPQQGHNKTILLL